MFLLWFRKPSASLFKLYFLSNIYVHGVFKDVSTLRKSVKVKVEWFMLTPWSAGLAPLILNLSTQDKGKVLPRTGYEGPEGEQMYCATLLSTSALDGVGCQRQASAALPPGKTRYSLYRRLGGLQGRSGRVLKISPPSRFDPRSLQPAASRYTDCAIPAP